MLANNTQANSNNPQFQNINSDINIVDNSKKKKKLWMVIFVAVMLLVGCVVGAYFVFLPSDSVEFKDAKAEAINQAMLYKSDGVCTMALVPATHTKTGAKYTFPNGCLAPGWVVDFDSNADTSRVETKEVELPPEIINISKGQKATIDDDLEFNVNSIIRNIPFESYGDNDTELIALNVSVRNIIENSRMFYDNSLRLLVDDVEYGDTYNSDEAYEPNFDGSITGGGKVHTGNIFFKIPKDAIDLKIQYTNKEYDSDLDKTKRLSIE
jgi:hypothetical protein